MAKRRPTSELNHENWDQDDKPEDQGVFKTAPDYELNSRVIKKARRKITNEPSKGDGESKSVFSSFSGFGKSSSTDSLSSIPTSSFSFLSKMNSPTSLLVIENDSQKEAKQKSETLLKTNSINYNFLSSNTYYAKLKNLNQEVTNWIKTHVDENPICILTPIFKDYEKYLKEIQDHEKNVKPLDKLNSNLVENVSVASSTALNTLKFCADSATKESPDTIKNERDVETDSSQFVIDNKNDKIYLEKPSIFGSAGSSKVFPTSSAGFTFGNQAKIDTNTVTSSGFSFSNSKPFTFGNVTTAKTLDNGKSEESEVVDDDDELPKVEVKLVVEENNVYSKRCKVFVKSGSNYNDRGVGTLYLKPITDSEKYQLLIRADTNLGNILLNIILNDAIPVQRMGKNNVMLVCIPTPETDMKKPVPTLLRVKTPEEADELLETINKYKKLKN